MARLVVKNTGHGEQVIELRLGSNHIGRSPSNHFQVEHPSVSARHCEVVLSDQGLLVRDSGSTNGTWVNGQTIQEAPLSAGQVLRLGEIEMIVETTEVSIAIPKFDRPQPAPPVVLSDGGLICPRHPEHRATHQCTHCREVLCDACVHWLRRRGGRLMKFCPLCSHQCVLLGGEKKKRRSLFQLWSKTVKLPFLHGSKPDAAD